MTNLRYKLTDAAKSFQRPQDYAKALGDYLSNKAAIAAEVLQLITDIVTDPVGFDQTSYDWLNYADTLITLPNVGGKSVSMTLRSFRLLCIDQVAVGTGMEFIGQGDNAINMASGLVDTLQQAADVGLIAAALQCIADIDSGLGYSDMVSKFSTELGGMFDMVKAQASQYAKVISDSKIATEDKLEAMLSVIGECPFEESDVEVPSDDMAVVDLASKYTGTGTGAVWNVSNFGNTVKSVAKAVVKTVVAVGKVIGGFLKKGWNLLKKAWKKYVVPAVISKDFVDGDKKSADYHIDIPLISATNLAGLKADKIKAAVKEGMVINPQEVATVTVTATHNTVNFKTVGIQRTWTAKKVLNYDLCVVKSPAARPDFENLVEVLFDEIDGVYIMYNPDTVLYTCADETDHNFMFRSGCIFSPVAWDAVNELLHVVLIDDVTSLTPKVGTLPVDSVIRRVPDPAEFTEVYTTSGPLERADGTDSGIEQSPSGALGDMFIKDLDQYALRAEYPNLYAKLKRICGVAASAPLPDGGASITLNGRGLAHRMLFKDPGGVIDFVTMMPLRALAAVKPELKEFHAHYRIEKSYAEAEASKLNVELSDLIAQAYPQYALSACQVHEVVDYDIYFGNDDEPDTIERWYDDEGHEMSIGDKGFGPLIGCNILIVRLKASFQGASYVRWNSETHEYEPVNYTVVGQQGPVVAWFPLSFTRELPVFGDLPPANDYTWQLFDDNDQSVMTIAPKVNSIPVSTQYGEFKVAFQFDQGEMLYSWVEPVQLLPAYTAVPADGSLPNSDSVRIIYTPVGLDDWHNQAMNQAIIEENNKFLTKGEPFVVRNTFCSYQLVGRDGLMTAQVYLSPSSYKYLYWVTWDKSGVKLKPRIQKGANGYNYWAEGKSEADQPELLTSREAVDDLLINLITMHDDDDLQDLSADEDGDRRAIACCIASYYKTIAILGSFAQSDNSFLQLNGMSQHPIDHLPLPRAITFGGENPDNSAFYTICSGKLDPLSVIDCTGINETFLFNHNALGTVLAGTLAYYAVHLTCKKSIMTVWYGATGDYPTFIPYSAGAQLNAARWHINTDEDVANYAQKIFTALVVAAIVIIAAVCIGVAAMKITKSLKLKRIQRESEASMQQWDMGMKQKDIAVTKSEITRIKTEMNSLPPDDPARQLLVDQLRDKTTLLTSQTGDLKELSLAHFKTKKKIRKLDKLIGNTNNVAGQATSDASEALSTINNQEPAGYDEVILADVASLKDRIG